MHSIRYNPQTQRWMLLGGQLEHSLHITSAHRLEIGKGDVFLAASHPKSPFVLEPLANQQPARGLLYAPEPPVGEYELILQQPEEEVSHWSVAHFEAWLILLQHRLIQLRRNPFLKHVRFVFDSSKRSSTLPLRRVGDLIATSEPLTTQKTIAVELIDQLMERETAFIVAQDRYGAIYVPSAPSYDDELWYLPAHTQPDFAGVHGADRQAVSEVLHLLFRLLNAAHLQFDWVLEIHTSLSSTGREESWWLQLYRQPHANQLPIAIQRLPETYVQQLRYALASLT